ncbi:MAG TPA: DnaJ domain-containing protein, partial [Actinomycetes bacterium]
MSTKDFLEKDYYKTLGVSKNAKADEIKKSYRKL